MPAPQPVSLCTAKRIRDALSALGLRSVARPDARVAVMAQWGSALHPCGEDTADVTVATIPAADLGAWLEPRVRLESCESCDGKGRFEDRCECHECGSAECRECDGEGCFLVPAETADVDLRVLADSAADQATDVLRDRVAP